MYEVIKTISKKGYRRCFTVSIASDWEINTQKISLYRYKKKSFPQYFVSRPLSPSLMYLHLHFQKENLYLSQDLHLPEIRNHSCRLMSSSITFQAWIELTHIFWSSLGKSFPVWRFSCYNDGHVSFIYFLSSGQLSFCLLQV